jgi:curved DNA-binding protein CbpA
MKNESRTPESGQEQAPQEEVLRTTYESEPNRPGQSPEAQTAQQEQDERTAAAAKATIERAHQPSAEELNAQRYEQIAQKEMDGIIAKRWGDMSDKEKAQYRNKNGEVDMGSFYDIARRNIFEVTADDNGRDGIDISREAFCQMIKAGLDPEDIRPTSPWEVIKHSIGRLDAWDVIRRIAKGGELLAVPFTDPGYVRGGPRSGGKGSRIMTVKELKDHIANAERDFQQGVIEKMQRPIITPPPERRARIEGPTPEQPQAGQETPERAAQEEVQPNPGSREIYERLGLSMEASKEEIRAAYRRAARATHPDHNPNNPKAREEFQAIQEAFDILNNPEKRKAYDEAMTLSMDLGSLTPEQQAQRKDLLKRAGINEEDYPIVVAEQFNGDKGALSVFVYEAQKPEFTENLTGKMQEDVSRIAHFFGEHGGFFGESDITRLGKGIYEGARAEKRRREGGFLGILMDIFRALDEDAKKNIQEARRRVA